MVTKREVGAVEVGQPRVRGRGRGRRLDLGREAGSDLELGLDRRDPGAQGVGGDALRRLGRRARPDADHAAARHARPTLA